MRCFVLIQCLEEGKSSSGQLFFSHLLPHPQPPVQEGAGDPFGPVRAGSGGGRAPKPPPLHPSRAEGPQSPLILPSGFPSSPGHPQLGKGPTWHPRLEGELRPLAVTDGLGAEGRF